MAAPANRLILTRYRLHQAGLNIDQYHELQDNNQAERRHDNQPPDHAADAAHDRENADPDANADADNPVNNIDDADNMAHNGERPPQNAENNVDDEVDRDVEAHDALIRSLQGLRTLAITLPKFDGDILIDDWLADFDRYSTETGRLTDENRLYDLISHLGREAKQWYNLQPQATQQDYQTLRDALQEKYQPTPQELLDTRGLLYTMKQGPHQSFREFAKTIQLKARTINMPDAEIVGICVNGARPTLKAHIAMARPQTMDQLLRLPVVVSDIQEEPAYNVLQQLNEKMDNIALSVQQVQTAQHSQKQVTFQTPRDKRSNSRSPVRQDQTDQDRYRQSPRQPWTPPPPRRPWTPPRQKWTPTQRPWTPTRQPWTPPQTRGREMHYPNPRSDRPPHQTSNCGKCGLRCRGNQQCPAFQRTCFRCGGIGHFRSTCRSRVNQFYGQ